MGAAEGFRAIAYQYKRFCPDVGDLVVVFGTEKDDLIFFNDAFLALESFDGRFTLEHQKGLGGQMVVHIRVVARHEIEYPRTKRVSAEERNESLIFFPGRAHGVVDICKFHSLSSLSLVFSLPIFFSLSDRARPRRDRLEDNDRAYTPRDFSGASRRRVRWRSFGRRNRARCWEDSRHLFWQLRDSRL